SLTVQSSLLLYFIFFFFKDPATAPIYTLSLHDALPILLPGIRILRRSAASLVERGEVIGRTKVPGYWMYELADLGNKGIIDFEGDRKSTRLNSSHVKISYAVFCLKKKKDDRTEQISIKK